MGNPFICSFMCMLISHSDLISMCKSKNNFFYFQTTLYAREDNLHTYKIIKRGCYYEKGL